jgi:hypothetical protein
LFGINCIVIIIIHFKLAYESRFSGSYNFRLLGLGFGLGKGIRVKIRVRIRVRVRFIGLGLKYKRIQNCKSLKIVTPPKR